jgi:hypothetical protein
MKRFLAGIVAAALVLMTMTLSVGAISYSQSNIDIEIIPGTYTGYRFFGPESPHSHIDTTQIAAVKFYVKFEDLKHHEPSNVTLAYNSGTTGWVELVHDLNNGLIIEIELTAGGVSQDDFFEAALSTEDYSIYGTYSVEILDYNDNVLGEGVYRSGNAPEPDIEYEGDELPEYSPAEEGEPEYTPDPEAEAESGHVPEPPPEPAPSPEPEHVPPPVPEHVPENTPIPNPKTNANIITATAMTIVSALAVLSMSRKAKRGEDDDE